MKKKVVKFIQKNSKLNTFFRKQNRSKFFFKKKILKLNSNNKLISYKNKIYCELFSIFNIIEFENLFKTIFNSLTACIRNIVSFCIIRTKNPLISISSYIFSSEMILPSLLATKNWMVYLESTLENIEQIKNNFIERIISIFNEKKLAKNGEIDACVYPDILILIPNQTVLIQILRKLYNKVNFINKRDIFSGKNKFKNKDFMNIKHGKVLYPADKRIYSSDGEKDLFKLGIVFKKDLLILKKKLKNSDIALISPLTICHLSKKKTYSLFSSLKICIIDDLSKLCMLNFENLLNILKKIMLCNKKIISSSTRSSNFLDCPFFQIFSFSNLIYQETLNILDNIANNSFFLFYQFNKKRNFLQSKILNYKVFKFKTKFDEKISEKRLKIFINHIFPVLKINSKTRLLIFVKSYAEYVLMRNIIWKFREIGKIEIIAFNEYIKLSEYISYKKRLIKKKKVIVIITERFYFFERCALKGFSEIIFYSFPLNWEFYFEICSFIDYVSFYSIVYLILHISDIDCVERIFGPRIAEKIFQNE
nr:U3 small nucleolar RNA-associated protein 25 isoform [Cryptomonas curvata]